nr:hypothetical protein [Deltaproteobacteria bacterium]
IITLSCFLIIGCSEKDEWVDEYSSLIRECKLGREISLPLKIPNGLAYDGKYVWSADYNNKRPGNIIAIDINSGIIKHSVSILEHMEGLTWDGRNFWVGAPAKKISKLAENSLRIVKTINSPTGEDADGLAWDGKYLWIASHFHGRRGAQIIKMDVDSKKILNEFNLPFKEVGDITYMDGYIWGIKFCLSDKPEEKPYIFKMDTDFGEIVRLYHTKELPRKMWGLTQINGKLWLSNEKEKETSVIKIIEVLFHKDEK